ncbi:DegT/DnrJ/EryC1/StrS family aminotransferase [Desulfothermus sp.]
MEIRFIDLKAQYLRIETKVKENISRVLEHGKFILGPEVYELEEVLANYVGTNHCICCSSGTDALLMSLMASGIGNGDIVFTTPFTFFATAEVIALCGAIPVFVDIDPHTFNIDPENLKKAILAVKQKDPTTYPIPDVIKKDSREYYPKAIIAVDIFGVCASYKELEKIAQDNDLILIEDGAQSFGGEYHFNKACSFGDIGCTSFFPAKPLGGYGDGGAVFTNSEKYARMLKSIRVHGQGEDKYENLRLGLNARLDTIQAAVLLAKMEVFDEEIAKRQEVAKRYRNGLKDIAEIKHQYVPGDIQSAFAQYCILVKNRNELCEFLKQKEIPTAIYYKKPLHLQKAFEYLGYRQGDMEVSERVSENIMAIPMHPYLEKEVQDYIIDCIYKFYNQ